MKLSDIDQGDLSAYTKFTGHAGLQEEITLPEPGVAVTYDYENFRFLIACKGGMVVADWTLSPDQMDKMLKLARATEKATAHATRTAKKLHRDEQKRLAKTLPSL